MKSYAIKAHPTNYKGVLFRSRLEARWAAFFDLAGWEWEYEPVDLNGWTPDFRVSFSCGHSECPERHTLLIEVKPYFDLNEFSGHPCMEYFFGNGIPADSSAAFGISPKITKWEMGHGDGGGIYDVEFWVEDSNELWKQAGNITQYHARRIVKPVTAEELRALSEQRKHKE